MGATRSPASHPDTTPLTEREMMDWHEAGWSVATRWPRIYRADDAFVRYFEAAGTRGPTEEDPQFWEKLHAFTEGWRDGKASNPR